MPDADIPDRLDGIRCRPEPVAKRAGYQGVRLKPPEQLPDHPYYERFTQKGEETMTTKLFQRNVNGT